MMRIFRGLDATIVRAPDDGAGAGAGGGLAAAAAAASAAGDAGAAAAGAGAGAAGAGAAGAAGAGDAAAAASTAAGAAAGAQADAAAAAAKASAPYVPEGLSDSFKGASDKDTIDKLWADIKARPQAPAKADDYKLEVPKELAGMIDPVKDPVLPLYRQIAKDLGMTQEQYQGSITKLYAKMAEAGLIEKPIDLNAEFVALSDGKGDTSAQIAAGQRAVLELQANIKALETGKQIDAATAQELTGAMLGNARAVKAIAALMKLVSKPGGLVNGGVSGASDGRSDEERALAQMYPSMAKKTA